MGRIAMISLHTSPLDQPGTGDAGAGGARMAPSVTTNDSITMARIPRILRVIGIRAGYG